MINPKNKKVLTPLEQRIVEVLKETRDIWKAIEIAQHYENQRLYDRVLDNILKYGVDSILEKPDRIFYGDNTAIHSLEEEIAEPKEPCRIWEGTDVGAQYDNVVTLAAHLGMECFNEFLKQRENRRPIMVQMEVKCPNPKAMKRDKSKSEMFRQACKKLGFVIEGEELFEYQGNLVATGLHSVTICKFK